MLNDSDQRVEIIKDVLSTASNIRINHILDS